MVDGVETYAHASGEIFFCRRAAWQVASTMGFVLNKNTGSFMGLTRAEESALHEVSRIFVLYWTRAIRRFAFAPV